MLAGVIVAVIGMTARRASAGVDGLVEPDAASDAGAGDATASEDAATPLACNGALCDTTNGSETGGSCQLAAPCAWVDESPAAWMGLVFVLGFVRRQRRRSTAGRRTGAR